jgi:hypothetical protein
MEPSEQTAAAVAAPNGAEAYKIPTVLLIVLALLILFGLLAVGANFGVTFRVGR